MKRILVKLSIVFWVVSQWSWLAGPLGWANSRRDQAVVVTGDQTPDKSYIPILTGADDLTAAPDALTNPLDAVTFATTDKYVDVLGPSPTGGTLVIRAG